MYSRYKDPSCSSPEAINYDFFSFIHGQIIHVNCWTFSGLSNAEKMRKLGIRKEVSDAILDERFRGVFGTQSLEYWIKETLEINYATLLRLRDRANNEETDLKSEGYLERCIVPESLPKVEEGYIILYKALSSTEPLFLEDGNLDISSLTSPRGNDFNSTHSAIYFSPQRFVAEQFREYISIRCPFSSTLLLKINIPNGLLASLQSEELWYGEHWKQFIWHCKNKTPLPQHLQYLESADLIKGHICTKPPAQLARLGHTDLQTEVSESDIFVLEDGEKGIQWCFNEDKFRKIMEGLRGGVHVEVFGPLKSVRLFSLEL